MSRTARFFDVIQILRQAKKPVVASELAAILEVNVRTIYRDIASLQASGVPIVGEAGIGYVMRSGYDLPPLAFSQEEMEAIRVGLSMLGRVGDSGLVGAAETVIAKISAVSDNDTISSVALRVSTWNEIPRSKLTPMKARQLIRDAIEISIKYKDLKAVASERVIRPIALFYYIDAVLIVAWCKLRNGYRNFRIDRIQSWQSTGICFEETRSELLRNWERQKD